MAYKYVTGVGMINIIRDNPIKSWGDIIDMALKIEITELVDRCVITNYILIGRVE